MSLPLIITPEAEADLAEAKAWYEQKREGLGEEFLLCVEAGLNTISRVPEAATEVCSGVRRVVVRRFPYGICYRVDSDQIAVLAVYHSQGLRIKVLLNYRQEFALDKGLLLRFSRTE